MPSMPPGCRAANDRLSTATLFLPGVPSSSLRSRPRIAFAPSTWKKDGVTFIADTCSEPAPCPTL